MPVSQPLKQFGIHPGVWGASVLLLDNKKYSWIMMTWFMTGNYHLFQKFTLLLLQCYFQAPEHFALCIPCDFFASWPMFHPYSVLLWRVLHTLWWSPSHWAEPLGLKGIQLILWADTQTTPTPENLTVPKNICFGRPALP